MDSNSGNPWIGSGSFGFATTATGNSSDIKMVLKNDGNVGIGTTSPEYIIDLADDSFIGSTPSTADAKYIRFIASNTTGKTSGGIIWKTNYGGDYTKISASIQAICENNYFRHGLAFFTGNETYTTNAQERMRIDMNGNVGIGRTDPSYRLDIKGSGYWDSMLRIYSGETNGKAVSFGSGNSYFSIKVNGNSDEALNIKHSNSYVGIGTHSPSYKLHVISGGNHAFNYIGYLNDGGGSSGDGYNSGGTGWGIYCDKSIATATAFYVTSDRRIKENIVDVPDNLALEHVRNIPCRYYEYKDKLDRGIKTIGFIAQEVNEVFPIAVSIKTGVIPNEMRILENISWEKIIDASKNTYKLTSDLQDVSGIKYKFYVSNDLNGSDEIVKEVVGNSDNTFTFEEKWDNVFCYGREVDDFHTISKDKLFALNFSATQELDRKVTVLESENETIKQENETIKQENKDLKLQMALLRSELLTIKAHLGI